MKLVVGLGNIGKEYEKTNHNAGFMTVDAVAEMMGFSFKNRGCESDYAEVNVQGEKFIVAKPRTYMNESGKTVKSLISKFKIDISDVLVVLDDIDQEPSYIKIKPNGSAGTHNGLKSIIRETGSTEFARLRVGIGSKAERQDLANFVLSKMHMSDEQKLGLEKASQAVYDFMHGLEINELMAKYNGDSYKNGKH